MESEPKIDAHESKRPPSDTMHATLPVLDDDDDEEKRITVRAPIARLVGGTA